VLHAGLGHLRLAAGMEHLDERHAGSEAQVAEAGKVLAETRRALYRILADGEPAAAEPE
jgi:hypothetical protein